MSKFDEMTIDEINARLADAAEELRDKWDELTVAGEQSLIADWVDGKMPEVRGLVEARAAQVEGITSARSISELGRQLGWTEAQISHAQSIGSDSNSYGEECVVVAHSGRELRSPAYPEPCSYFRICQYGFELAYWNAEEVAQDPELVLGAIMGMLHADVPAPDTHELQGMLRFDRSSAADRG